MVRQRSNGEPQLDRRTMLSATGAAATGTVLGSQQLGTGVARTDSAQRAQSSISTENLTIESWDGTELAATLMTPKGTGPHPAVMMTHGWGAFRQDPLTLPRAKFYAKNGYTVLTWDSRGFAASEGTVTLNGPNEVKDVQHLLTWLANRPEVATEAADNPWVGMDGISYAGGIQFQAAAADDRLDALIPRITWNDIEYSLAPNGVIKVGWLSALIGLGEFNTLLDGDAELMDDLTDWYWHAIMENEVPADAVDTFKEISFAYDDEIETPTFLVQGWNDSLFNPTEALDSYRELQEAGVESRIAFYRGGHDLTEVTVDFEDREKMMGDALAWLDKFVRGKDSDIPNVQNYLTQRDEWRADESWPPTDTAKTYYSAGDADVSGETTLEQGWFTNKSVTFEWEFAEPVEVIGEPTIEVDVDVHGPEARLFFELFHNGDTINGMDEAYLVDGNGTHHIQLRYPAIQQFLGSGDALGLQISVSNPWYINSRESAGVTITPSGTGLHAPTRPADEHDSEQGGGGPGFTLPAVGASVAGAGLYQKFRSE